MELITSKTLTHYRILIQNISSPAKKQGQKSHHAEEHERGYNSTKCNSEAAPHGDWVTPAI